MLDVGTLLAVKCGALEVTLSKPLINHSQAGTGIFTARWFGKGDVVGQYYGSLVYDNMILRHRTTRTYGELSLQVTQETCCKGSNCIPEMVKDEEVNEHAVWIVPAPFCAMLYINDILHLPGDATPEAEQVRQVHKNDVDFYQTWSLDSASDLTSSGILAVHCKRNIDWVEELYLDYGSLYDFSGR